MLRKGTVLRGIYRIDSYLSSGGFGNTYVATNIEFDEQVAIKEFFMKGVTQRDGNQTTVSVSNSENKDSFLEQREKFKKEARRIRQLKNKHIVTVHDLFDENGTSYYVMDYVNGENLSERLKRTGRAMTESEVRLILPQILDALKAVHEAGIWHLDLKPANIMMDKDGKVKLIDFGASKQLNAQKGGATTGTAVSYTNGYAPREQMEQNYDKFGPWTDIYALGATLYTLLTNKRPPLPTDIDDDISEDKHVALPMPASVSEQMRHLVLQMLQTNRQSRPQSVIEVMRQLASSESAPSAGNTTEETEITIISPSESDNKAKEREETNEPKMKDDPEPTSAPSPQPVNWKLIGFALACVVVIFLVLMQMNNNGKSVESINQDMPITETSVESINRDMPITETSAESINQVMPITETSAESGMSPILQNLVNNIVRVDGGTFKMGATAEQDSDAYDNEEPVHQVTLSSFSIGKYEVTQEEWVAVMGSNPSSREGAKRSVDQVSWTDCQEFIRKLNELTGMSFRLPTEAEWEFAARGGTKSVGYKYAGSDNLGNVAWYDGNSGDATHEVGQKSPNELGLYDMSGNVWEWCADWYGEYGSSAQTNPMGPSSGSYRVLRGGSWGSRTWGCRVSGRGCDYSSLVCKGYGFRLAL